MKPSPIRERNVFSLSKIPPCTVYHYVQKQVLMEKSRVETLFIQIFKNAKQPNLEKYVMSGTNLSSNVRRPNNEEKYGYL